MREIIEFKFNLRREYMKGDLRCFTEEEMSRIQEIMGCERDVGEFKDEDDIGPRMAWNRIKVSCDAEAESTKLLLQELTGPFGRIIEYYGAYHEKVPNLIPALRRREYSAKEINECPFFHVWADKEIADTGIQVRWSTGAYAIEKKSIKKQPIGSPGGNMELLACQDPVREAFEAEGFQGLTFEEMEQTGKSKKPHQPIWRLRGRTDLPWTKNHFVGDDYKPLDSYPKEGSCHIQDRCFPWRLIYAKSDLLGMDGLDVGETRETFGWFTEGSDAPSEWFRRPYLVVSQKFKRFCDTKKFKLDFHPVELI